MYHGLYPVALQLYVSSAVSGVRIRVCLHVAIVVSLIMPRLHYVNATLAGLPEYQHRRLQSVLNAAARLIHRTSRCQHITLTSSATASLATVQRTCGFQARRPYIPLPPWSGTRLLSLSGDIRSVADTNRRRRLRSSSSALLTVRQTRLATIGDCAFPVADSRLWNSLPHDVTAPTLSPYFLYPSENISVSALVSHQLRLFLLCSSLTVLQTLGHSR